jgi:hypothetical protein
MSTLSALVIWLGSVFGMGPCEIPTGLSSFSDAPVMACPADPPDEDEDDGDEDPDLTLPSIVRYEINNGL